MSKNDLEDNKKSSSNNLKPTNTKDSTDVLHIPPLKSEAIRREIAKTGLKGGELSLLSFLAVKSSDFKKDGNQIRKSNWTNNKLCDAVNLSYRQIQRITARLEERAFLIKKPLLGIAGNKAVLANTFTVTQLPFYIAKKKTLELDILRLESKGYPADDKREKLVQVDEHIKFLLSTDDKMSPPHDKMEATPTTKVPHTTSKFTSNSKEIIKPHCNKDKMSEVTNKLNSIKFFERHAKATKQSIDTTSAQKRFIQEVVEIDSLDLALKNLGLEEMHKCLQVKPFAGGKHSLRRLLIHDLLDRVQGQHRAVRADIKQLVRALPSYSLEGVIRRYCQEEGFEFRTIFEFYAGAKTQVAQTKTPVAQDSVAQKPEQRPIAQTKSFVRNENRTLEDYKTLIAKHFKAKGGKEAIEYFINDEPGIKTIDEARNFYEIFVLTPPENDFAQTGTDAQTGFGRIAQPEIDFSDLPDLPF